MRMTFILSVTSLCLVALTAVAANEVTVVQKDKVFSTDEVNLALGGSIAFTNEDSVSHNVSVKAPNGENKGNFLEKPGEVARVSMDQPGDWRVFCLIHPKMKLSVHVH